VFLFGENDSLATIEIASEPSEMIPDGRLVMMKDSGHRNLIKQPEVFGKNVADVLRE
jgi:hypothetical protein